MLRLLRQKAHSGLWPTTKLNKLKVFSAQRAQAQKSGRDTHSGVFKTLSCNFHPRESHMMVEKLSLEIDIAVCGKSSRKENSYLISNVKICWIF